MATVDLTIRVDGLPSNVKKADLIAFFSYCGTIDQIELPKENGSKSARVTFKQPYAQQTALLLNNATILGCQVHILPDKGGTDKALEETQPAGQHLQSRGYHILRRADGALGNVGSLYFTAGVLWLSNALDKAGKCTAKLAIDNINKEKEADPQ